MHVRTRDSRKEKWGGKQLSLRDLGIFAPLKKSHPMVRQKLKCSTCDEVFLAGTRCALEPIETPEESGSLTVEARPVCATCYLRGVEIQTPEGKRIVHSVKGGRHKRPVVTDYPIVTEEWADEDVGPVPIEWKWDLMMLTGGRARIVWTDGSINIAKGY